MRKKNRSKCLCRIQNLEDSLLLDLARSCKELECYLNSETFHEVYKILIDSKLRKFRDNFISILKCKAFLELIGITYREGTFFSNKDIDVYIVDRTDEVEEDSEDSWHIFDGNVEIMFEVNRFELDIGDFTVVLHETRESLDGAKRVKGRTRVASRPE
ncbi:hypothetical protein PENTCL1PPCAC_19633 [Pristionchus entomophagus]|uniref:F-box domain-containing protein n=1 Tax=Pristionchus entomophagus TaxID=358040 RepID=A0AAV5TTS4_9BILA|nr:hypothetical protein PENTCL1PPCAC_19633 [Pristionchus entomophagus]